MPRAISYSVRLWNLPVNPSRLRPLSACFESAACRPASVQTTECPSPRPMLCSTSPSFPCGGCVWASPSNASSTVFAGQAVGIKEVEEGIWLVSFMDYDLGYIDLEEKTLQPLDNPFGPKVLPM